MTARKKARTTKQDNEPAAVEYSPQRVEAAAKLLRGLAADFDGFAKAMRDEGIAEIAVRDKMLRRSVHHINNFADQLRRGIRERRGLDL